MEILISIGFTALGIAIGSVVTFWRLTKEFTAELDHQREMRRIAERHRKNET